MGRQAIQLRLAPVPRRFARIYRARGIEPPLAASGHPWAALIPYRFRAFHRAYAASHGYFWLRCLLCSEPHGGHEIAGTVPDPTRPGVGIMICPECTRSQNRAEAR